MGISKPNANIAQLLFLVQQKPTKTSIGMFIQLLSKESETLQGYFYVALVLLVFYNKSVVIHASGQ